MTREEAIQVLHNIANEEADEQMTREEPKRCETCRYDGMCIRQTHTMAIVDNCDRYEEYKDRPHGEWIPCSERLPEDEGKYLVSLNYGDVTMDSFIDGMFIMNLINVVAWMPLPEPYKKEGGEK